MERLTSRKLAIAIITIVAAVALVPFVGLFPDTKAFIAVTTVGLAALGGQFLLDNMKGGI